ncbi:MAG: DUF433 domain-containing protein [Verrucomicrobiae bacterium]
MKSSIVSIAPEIMGGAPCFAGTRVSIRTLFDCVEVRGLDSRKRTAYHKRMQTCFPRGQLR